MLTRTPDSISHNYKNLAVTFLIAICEFLLSACGGGGGGSSNGSPVASALPAPSALAYTSPLALTVGTPVSALAPTVTGTVSTYTVSPALPDGLALNAATGVISGTPTTAAANATYTVTATNTSGGVSFSLALMVNQQAIVATSLTAHLSTQSSIPMPVPLVPALTGPLSKVRSYEYAIAANTDTPGIYSAIANSPSDLILMSYVPGGSALNRSAADPSGTKLIFGYVNVGEAAPWLNPSLFSGDSLPTFLGKPVPGYTDLYSVQYWNPAWESALFPLIDEIIANGFDGIFLDVLTADTEWKAGNVGGNPVYPDATAALATLIGDIRSYVNAHYPGRAIYLIGNNPSVLAMEYPAVLKKLDAIFNENVYYIQPLNNGLTSQYIGAQNSMYLVNTLGPAYMAANIPIFGNDYPLPLADITANLQSFSLYSALGWIPSVTTAHQTSDIFSTGPFMFMATSNNSTATGARAFTNYLSGGVAAMATLTGGDHGDIFIGGPGQNTITGGAGNDVIYAHPEYAAYKGKLVLGISSGLTGSATTPSVALSVNGQSVLQATPVTALYGTQAQVITVDIPSGTAVTSVVLTVTNTSYTDGGNFSNVNIQSVIYDGVRIDPRLAAYSSGASNNGYTYSNNGTVTFPTSTFAVNSPFLPNVSDVIDGGAGANTVIYRGPSNTYSIVKQSDGSWIVRSSATAEGPDTLKNIQSLKFTDKTVSLQ